MTPVLPLLHTLSAAAASALVMGVAEGVALTACVAVLLRLFPGLSAGARSAVWMAALGMSVLLPAGSLLLARDAAGAENGRGVAQIREGWALGLVAVWAALSMVRLAALAVSAGRLRQVWRRAVPVPGSARCGELLRAGGRSAVLCVSIDVDRPSVVGFLRPRVLLPPALLEELSPEEMEHVVRHEMEHLRRHDDWTNLLQKLSLAVFPLNPVLFWLDWRLCQERELACDDGVLRQTRARKAYAACLAGLAEDRVARRASALVLGAWGRQSELSRRIHRILDWRDSTLARRPAALLAGLFVLSVTAGGVELARCPELLQFTSGPQTLADATDRVARPPMSGFTVSATAMPVMTRASESAEPMLVQAGLRVPVASAMPVRSFAGKRNVPSRKRVALRRVRQASPRQGGPAVRGLTASRVLLTAWPEEQFPARLLLTVVGEDQPRYAAIATRDGWLFVSL